MKVHDMFVMSVVLCLCKTSVILASLGGTKLEMNVPFNDAAMDCWPCAAGHMIRYYAILVGFHTQMLCVETIHLGSGERPTMS